MSKSVNLALITVLALSGANCAFAATKPASAGPTDADVTVKQEKDFTPKQIDEVCSAAGDVLLDVDKARKTIAAKKIDEAKKIVDSALASTKVIKANMPTFLVTTSLTEGKKHTTQNQTVQPLLVPLFEELNSVSVLEPVKAAKKEAKTAAKKEVKAADSNAPAAMVEMVASHAFLDVESASQGLEKAQKALAAGKATEADKNLLGVMDDVIIEADIADVPINKAQANLLLAQQDIKNNKLDKAKADLQASSAALADYQKGAGASKAKEVGDMRTAIDNFANTLQTDIKAANTNIEKWWQTMASWFTKSAK